MNVLGAAPKRFAMMAWGLAVGLSAASAWAAHGYAEYGDLKYPAGFTHFAYLNPKAPIGGTLTLGNPDRRTSFDKFNPFTIKGTAAPGLNALVFESLLIGSWDETASGYGLLADDVTVAPDELSVTFHLNPLARFSNGDPVRAADVKYSYDMLMGKGASPAYRSMTADVTRVTVVDERTIRYDFKRRNKELPLTVGNLPVFSPKWGKGSGKPEDPDGGKDTPFDKVTFQEPIGSGPYLIERYDGTRGITFRRNPDYWGRNLSVRRGAYNFERIQYKLYKDETARLEAFKAGEYDAMVEYRAKNWAKSYVGVKFRSGELVKSEFPHRNGAGMQGFVMNLRKPIFRDLRVRRALALALDFEWLNRQLFYGAYRRLDSYFANSELAAADAITGMPGKGELALLEPLRSKLDPEVFGVLLAPPSTDPPGSLRDNLRQARRLLAQGRLDLRQRRAAQRQGRAVYLRDARRRRCHEPRDGGLRAQPGEARHPRQPAHYRLRAVPEAPGRVRLRHDLAAFSRFDEPRQRAEGPLRLGGGRRAGLRQRDRSEVAGSGCADRRRAARGQPRGTRDGIARARPCADTGLLRHPALVFAHPPRGLQPEPDVPGSPAVLLLGRGLGADGLVAHLRGLELSALC